MRITRVLTSLDPMDTEIIRCKKSFTLVDEIDEIGSYALSHLLNLEEIEIPASIKKVCAYAFFDCHNLKKVKLCGAIKIHEDSFSKCDKLEKIVLTQNVLKELRYTPTRIEKYTNHLKNSTNKNVIILTEDKNNQEIEMD